LRGRKRRVGGPQRRASKRKPKDEFFLNPVGCESSVGGQLGGFVGNFITSEEKGDQKIRFV